MSDALNKLIDAVEAGTSDRQDLLHMIDKAMPQDNRGCMATAHQAYNGSLDAALALHEALLPGWAPGMSKNVHHGHWFAWVQNKDREADATSEKPARAWLLAILRAYRSVQA